MRHQLEIRSSTSDSRIVFSGEAPRGLSGYDGCTFEVALEGRPVWASVAVYDIQPQGWSELFASLARDWRGWAGERSHESLEGHLRLSATCDSLGHVSLRVVLRGDFVGSNWRAEDTLSLEAGQLERIAKEVGQFFG